TLYPDNTKNYWADLRAIGTPEACKAIEPIEKIHRDWKQYGRPLYQFINHIMVKITAVLGFAGLFLWSRARTKKGNKAFHGWLLIPMGAWALYLIFPTALLTISTAILWRPMNSLAGTKLMHMSIGELLELYTLLGLGLATLLGVVPCSVCWLWQREK
ncbi:MAG: hypothetical protein AAB339_00825, partial [Elusimicrobiota bacterium]